jgi:5-methylcytosine-specific restriction endonuclease McrA
MRTLVLNADFMPLHVMPLSTISWQEAMCLWVGKKATPICYHEKTVRTVNEEYKIPSVLVLKEYKHFTKHAKYTKVNVKIRDDFKCMYCGKTHSLRSLTIDHVLARANGGKTSWENTVAACKPCNQKKMDKNGWKPIRTPYRPTYYELAKKVVKRESVMHEDWKPYIRF